jgi:hypothetical protein
VYSRHSLEIPLEVYLVDKEKRKNEDRQQQLATTRGFTEHENRLLCGLQEAWWYIPHESASLGRRYQVLT